MTRKNSNSDYQSSLFDNFKTQERKEVPKTAISTLDAIRAVLPFISPFSSFSKKYIFSRLDDRSAFYKLLNRNIIREISTDLYRLNDVAIINQYLEKHNLRLETVKKEGVVNRTVFSSEEEMDRAVKWDDFRDFVEFGTKMNDNVVKFKFNGRLAHVRTFPYLFAAKLAALRYLESEGILKVIDDEDVRLELVKA